MCVDGWKYADVTRGQSRRILIPYKRHSAASIFLLLSRSAPPFRRQTAKRAHYFFILKMNAEERKRELPRARAGDGAAGGGDTLLIKTIDLSPGLRMHLEINTRGLARARTHLPLERAFPDDHISSARYLPLVHSSYSPSAKISDFLTTEEASPRRLESTFC